MKAKALEAAALTVLLSAFAGAATLPAGSAEILSRIHGINEMEIRAGNLAEQRASSPEVRRLGTLLARDHEEGERRIFELSRRQKLTVTSPEPEPADKAAMDRLEAADGPGFDRVFLETMREGHEKAVSLLTALKGQPADASTKNLIALLLPLIRQHGELSQHLQRRT